VRLSGKADIMRSVNEGIALLANDLDAPADHLVWTFVCECGAEECTSRVELELRDFVVIRGHEGNVLAPDHVVVRARIAQRAALRTQTKAADLRADLRSLLEQTQAVQAQARQQVRRARRFH
jgi:hypothetical protein